MHSRPLLSLPCLVPSRWSRQRIRLRRRWGIGTRKGRQRPQNRLWQHRPRPHACNEHLLRRDLPRRDRNSVAPCRCHWCATPALTWRCRPPGSPTLAVQARSVARRRLRNTMLRLRDARRAQRAAAPVVVAVAVVPRLALAQARTRALRRRSGLHEPTQQPPRRQQHPRPHRRPLVAPVVAHLQRPTLLRRRLPMPRGRSRWKRHVGYSTVHTHDRWPRGCGR